MTTFKTALIAGLLTLASTSAFAADEMNASAPEMDRAVISTLNNANMVPVKAPVLLAERAPSRRIVKVVYEPVARPVVRKANMSANTKFVFSSPKNTNTKTYKPSAMKNAAMPNLFKN